MVFFFLPTETQRRRDFSHWSYCNASTINIYST